MRIKVVRRTFAAKKFPVGSVERAELNLVTLTSEYYPSRPYAVVENGIITGTNQTKRDALAYVKERLNRA